MALDCRLRAMNSQVGFIVMVPGTGKSYNHGKVEGLYEADTLVGCKSTEKLITLRKEAKESGNWEQYDNEWISMLKTIIAGQTCVVMVPSFEVGWKAGWTYLDTICVEREVWERNLKLRGEEALKYAECEEKALTRSFTKTESNKDTEKYVAELARQWMK